jgi:exopolysaccharide biosynthesis polyprenyl glycosylphosphotransferase
MGVKSRKYLLLFFDIFFLYFSLFLALFLRYFGKFEVKIFFSHFLPFTILFFFWLIVFYSFGFYDFEFLKTSLVFKTISATSLNFVVGVLLFYFIPHFKITPKAILILNSLIFGIFFFEIRKFFLSFFSAHLFEKVVILGEGAETEKLKKEINEKPFLGYKVIELDFSKDLLDQIKKEGINTIVFFGEPEKDPKFQNLFYNLLFLGVNFLDFPSFYERITEKIPVTSISKVWFFENLKEGEKRIYDKFKRAFDVGVASVILLFTLPLWLLIALAIKIEDAGPVFYIQERVGKNKKIFKLIKFRSMIKEAEKEGPKWAEVEDQRVTKVGKFLRRFHLDEIPQMINVIRGDISLVGPRPERPEFVEKLEKEIPYYNLRHIIKPGFTGWAQIKFRYARSVMDSLEKFQYDLYYIKNRSLLLDLKILLKTFQLFFKKE